jgi:hypothetical protein
MQGSSRPGRPEHQCCNTILQKLLNGRSRRSNTAHVHGDYQEAQGKAVRTWVPRKKTNTLSLASSELTLPSALFAPHVRLLGPRPAAERLALDGERVPFVLCRCSRAWWLSLVTTSCFGPSPDDCRACVARKGLKSVNLNLALVLPVCSTIELFSISARGLCCLLRDGRSTVLGLICSRSCRCRALQKECTSRWRRMTSTRRRR